MNEMQERQDLFSRTKEELDRRAVSNAESFDRAILSLSAASLGFSLAFLARDPSPGETANLVWLVWSWVFFIVAIASTLSSFLVSQIGLRRQLELAKQYYLKSEEAALTAKNRPARAVSLLAYVAGTMFLLAVCFTLVFVFLNVSGRQQMPRNERPTVGGGIQKGAPIPSLQPVSSPATEPSASQPATQPAAPSSGTSSKKD